MSYWNTPSCRCTPSGIGCNQPITRGCPDQYGCIPGVCPDFTIRRHDNRPPFKVRIEDCDGPMDLTGLVLEATMWAKGKLKKDIADTDTYFALADNIGFNQIMVGDIIVMDRPRLPEQMLVVGFDEDDRLVLVQRGYHGTTPQAWKKGSCVKIMKFQNAQAQTEMIYEDQLNLDGTTTKNVLTDSFLIYDWGPDDTCLPGCYYLEFKLIKMLDQAGPVTTYPDGETVVFTPDTVNTVPTEIVLPDIIPSPGTFIGPDGMSVTPTFTPSTDMPSTFGCGLGAGVDWIRRFPVEGEGFYIKITDSPTAEV